MLPMLFSAAVRDLWAPDEPRYAEVAKEIFQHGSALVMHLCGALYPDKPPLLFWLSGAAGKLSGFSEFAMRWPSIIGTLLTAWMVVILARRWWGELEARWAPIFFLSFAMVTEIGGRLQIDPLLTALGTGALTLGSLPAKSSGTRSMALIGAGLLVGFGALAKGPVAYVNVGLVALVWFLLFQGKARPPRVAPWVWLLTILACLGPVLLWAVAAAEQEPRLWNALFYDQHIGRVVKADRHPGPIWQSVLRLPLFLTPWFFLIFQGLLVWWKQRKTDTGLFSDEGSSRAIAWMAVLLIFYSIIPPKRDLYLLPLYPAAALLAARTLAVSFDREHLSNWITWASGAIMAILGITLAAAGWLYPQVAGLKLSGFLAGLALLLGSIFSISAGQRYGVIHWARTISLSWLCFAILTTLLIFPSLNSFKSARTLAFQLAERSEKPAEIPFVGRVRPEGYRFYAGIPAVSAHELGPFLKKNGDNFLGVIAKSSWTRLSKSEKRYYRVLEETQVGGKKMLILGRARP